MTGLPVPFIPPGADTPFPSPESALVKPNGLLAIGADLSPQRLLAAYARGIFPWYGDDEPILWWSPNPRCVFDTGAMHVSRSLLRQLHRSQWTLSADQAFRDVITACASPRDERGGVWLVQDMIEAYCRLHEMGHAHSVEVWDGETLVGGIYGIAVGRAFCGESMFSHATGGSKVALLALAHTLHAWQFPLLDAQVPSPHLFTLGATLIPRRDYLARLAALQDVTQPPSSWRHRWPLKHAHDLAQPLVPLP